MKPPIQRTWWLVHWPERDGECFTLTSHRAALESVLEDTPEAVIDSEGQGWVDGVLVADVYPWAY